MTPPPPGLRAASPQRWEPRSVRSSHTWPTPLPQGAGLCDVAAPRVLVDEGPLRIEELIALGAEFDRDPQGRLELAREGGHSVARVLHAGGAATGAEIERTLVTAVRRTAVEIHTRTFLEDLVVRDGVCLGAWCRFPDGSRRQVRSRNVLLAAGGAGRLFSVTTNPAGATGDGGGRSHACWSGGRRPGVLPVPSHRVAP
ncbi:MAG: FAD-binding protein [Microthrixaceae bacterium]|nr:FAD-binding protein [Microthrixaceae bacterium]